MIDAATKHYKAVVTGRRNKVAGEYWEQMIDSTCRWYSDQGIAEILKTPEAMRPIKRLPEGKFIAVFTKMAQPDYKGTLKGGKAIIFDAKHTDTDRLKRDAVTSEQEKQFDRHEALGAECYILASFGFERYFKIPWQTFKQMKEKYGRKYVTPGDLEEYEIRYEGGVLKFISEEG